ERLDALLLQLARRESLHQGAVDLDEMHVEFAEQSDRLIAGAEVLEREAEAALAEPLREFLGLPRILRRELLGDLETQALRVDARRPQLRFEPRDQSLVEQRVLRYAQ